MTQTSLFFLLLVTILLSISGVREAAHGRYAMAATLVLIPLAGWVALLFGKASP